jgi:hypothetical protein
MDIFEIAGTVFAGLIIGILGKFFAPGNKDNIPMGLAGMPRVMSGASDPRGGRVQLGARLGERLAQMPFDGSGVQPCHHIDSVRPGCQHHDRHPLGAPEVCRSGHATFKRSGSSSMQPFSYAE